LAPWQVAETDLAARGWRGPWQATTGLAVHVAAAILRFQYLECLKMLEAADLQRSATTRPTTCTLVEAIKLASAGRTEYATAELATISALMARPMPPNRQASVCAVPPQGERYVAQVRRVRPGAPGRVAASHHPRADRWGKHGLGHPE
jgi:hypothetical protein